MTQFKVKVTLEIPEEGKEEPKIVSFDSDVLAIQYRGGIPVFLVYSEETGFLLVESTSCKKIKSGGGNNKKKK